MKITIGGTPGSGKGCLARDLAKALGFKQYCIGDMRRLIAEERGITLAELNRHGEEDFWTDKDVDIYQEKIGKEEDDFIFDGRLSWHFIPDSIKIFLDADEDLRAKRIFGRPSSEENFEAIKEVKEANKSRMESDKKRYMKYYGVDPYDMSHYDIVIYTTGHKPEDTLKIALEEIEKHKV